MTNQVGLASLASLLHAYIVGVLYMQVVRRHKLGDVVPKVRPKTRADSIIAG